MVTIDICKFEKVLDIVKEDLETQLLELTEGIITNITFFFRRKAWNADAQRQVWYRIHENDGHHTMRPYILEQDKAEPLGGGQTITDHISLDDLMADDWQVAVITND